MAFHVRAYPGLRSARSTLLPTACWRWSPFCRTIAKQCPPHRCACANGSMAQQRPRVRVRWRRDQAPGCACREWPTWAWGRATFSRAAPSNRFDQHGAALAAADAFGGDAALFAEPLHGIDEMQHDPVAASANRMADADGAAVDIKNIARDAAGRCIEPERVAAELGILPSGETAQNLRGERFVQLPQFDVAEGEAVTLEQRGRAIDRTESHHRWIERRPFAVNDNGFRRELVGLDRFLRGENDPGGAVGDLRTVSRRHLAPRPLEGGVELGEGVDRGVGAHAVIVNKDRAVAREGGFDLAGEIVVLLRRREPLLAFG